MGGPNERLQTCLTRSHIRNAFTVGFSVAAPPFLNPGGLTL
jgi:hypothetical protein